jgi:hypothetical protein
MRSRIILLAIGVGLLALGWSAHAAQTSAPEFTLTIDAPVGETTVVCVKGCVLQGGRDYGNPDNRPSQKYGFKCGRATNGRCSARVNGWLQR